ncbi:toll/interleukin-1 receptor domain-containing protein [Tsukamurella sp. 8F]|uniref:toll/interleukin-1 receptor domain-containing protein n=1 Tax=unclassified Tsukamurella TaxID=2633480 RepID=UPI0023B8A4F9|nr:MULTISPECIES: toll/interleukin-1 receptor domain-containing protein [unclassified Tsukamurella]MDF0528650.1 toll/interleukin-1 receptor domain-containing protein [Tsukamurella sp. 8J]MDF0585612.1 toll/interleukin-1 receptor domain-containing protein [Tsukamurella sp. 8F]
MAYTTAERRSLAPVRRACERQAQSYPSQSYPDRRDLFLCHAWDDRRGAAKELHDLLEALGVTVWFSEKDVTLGTSLLRAIDKGLGKSRIGIVLVTPAMLKSIQAEGVADKELSCTPDRVDAARSDTMELCPPGRQTHPRSRSTTCCATSAGSRPAVSMTSAEACSHVFAASR